MPSHQYGTSTKQVVDTIFEDGYVTVSRAFQPVKLPLRNRFARIADDSFSFNVDSECLRRDAESVTPAASASANPALPVFSRH